MAILSVNVNKIATLRNSRGKNSPDVLATTMKIISYGAEGITVHPRPDGRHIRWPDVHNIAAHLGNLELNIEGYPSERFIQKVLEVSPAQCTLVPDSPDVLTSNAGWKVEGNEQLLEKTITTLKQAGIRVSLFVDPFSIKTDELLFFRDLGADRIELYTERYADTYDTNEQDGVLKVYQSTAALADSMGLGINAGHDLNLNNLRTFVRAVPQLLEASIGHALVCDALDLGLRQSVFKYLAAIKGIANENTLNL